jgi:hypothetical protein
MSAKLFAIDAGRSRIPQPSHSEDEESFRQAVKEGHKRIQPHLMATLAEEKNDELLKQREMRFVLAVRPVNPDIPLRSAQACWSTIYHADDNIAGQLEPLNTIIGNLNVPHPNFQGRKAWPTHAPGRNIRIKRMQNGRYDAYDSNGVLQRFEVCCTSPTFPRILLSMTAFLCQCRCYLECFRWDTCVLGLQHSR